MELDKASNAASFGSATRSWQELDPRLLVQQARKVEPPVVRREPDGLGGHGGGGMRGGLGDGGYGGSQAQDWR